VRLYALQVVRLYALQVVRLYVLQVVRLYVLQVVRLYAIQIICKDCSLSAIFGLRIYDMIFMKFFWTNIYVLCILASSDLQCTDFCLHSTKNLSFVSLLRAWYACVYGHLYSSNMR